MNQVCTVPSCPNPRPEHTSLCVNCTTLLSQDLDAALWLLQDLDTTIARQDAVIPPNSRGRSAETALPFKWHASEALWVLQNVTTTWARLVLEHTGFRPPADTSAFGAAGFLRAHVRSFATHPDAGEAVGELETAVRDALRAVDHPVDHRMYLGKCGDVAGHHGCQGRVYALPQQEEGTCDRCHATHPTRERRALMLRAMAGQKLTAQEMSTMLAAVGVEITVAQIQNVGRLRRITPTSSDKHGKRSYRVGDVLREFLGPDFLAA